MDALYKFWFDQKNEHMWFGATPEDDKLITEKFGDYLDHGASCAYSSGKIMTISNIIIYDQISRHVARHKGEALLPKWQEMAFVMASGALKYTGIDKFTNKEIPFVLLPFRHSNKKENIMIAKDIIIEMMEMRAGTDDESYLRRFYQATLRQLSSFCSPDHICSLMNENDHLELAMSILAPDSIQDIKKPRTGRLSNSLLMKKLREAILTCGENPKIILSVSGGKDSMALATALYALKTMTSLNFELAAVHINYMNRETSVAEEWLVRHYLVGVLGIHTSIRRIDELQRSRHSHERDFYEAYTKEVRFKAYLDMVDGYSNSYVILGHNHDDTIENIITNITKKKHFDNLKGMTIHSRQMDVNLFRPLLEVTKVEIEEFNKLSDTPFTYDSTPDWSDRGRIRDKVIPALKEFNPATVSGLVDVSNTLAEMDVIYRKFALPQILKEIVVDEIDNRVEIPYNKVPVSVKVLRDIFDHFKLSQPSAKSMANLVEQVKVSTHIREIKLTKEVTAIIDTVWKCVYIPY